MKYRVCGKGRSHSQNFSAVCEYTKVRGRSRPNIMDSNGLGVILDAFVHYAN